MGKRKFFSVLLFAVVMISTVSLSCKKDDDDDALNDSVENTNGGNTSNSSDNANNGGSNQNNSTTNKEDAKTYQYIYEVTNERDETVYLVADTKIIATIGQAKKVSGVYEATSTTKSFYVKNASGKKFESKTVSQGKSYIVTVHDDCYYNNVSYLKIVNNSDKTFNFYYDNELAASLSSGKTYNYSITPGEHKLYVEQTSHYYFYATKHTTTINPEACQTTTWTLND